MRPPNWFARGAVWWWMVGGLTVGSLPLALAAVHPLRDVVTAHGGLDSTVQVAYLANALHHPPWSAQFWNLPIFWPNESATVMMDPTLAPAALLRLIWWGAGRNPALDANLLFVFTLASSFWAAAWWARRLGAESRASAVAGLVYALGPFAVGHWQHLNQLPSAWLPLVLGAWHGLVHDPHHVRRWSVVLFGALTVQLLSSVYLFAATSVGLFVSVLVWPPRRVAALRGGLVAMVGVAAATYAWSRPFAHAVHAVEGYGRSAADTGPFQARLFDLGFAAQSHLLPWPGHELTRPALYPGIVWTGLAVVGLFALWRRSRHIATHLALLGGVGLLLAMGRSHPGFGGAEWPLPFAWLQDHVSPWRALRDPSRFFVLTHLSLALLGGLGWQRLRGRGVWVSALLVVALIDLAPGRAERVRVTPAADDREVLQWLRAQPQPAVWSFDALPCREQDESGLDARATLWAALSGVPTVGGSTGFVPPVTRALRAELCHASADRLVAGLQRAGVRWLVAGSGFDGRDLLAQRVLRNETWSIYSLASLAGVTP